jgi:transposase
VLDGRKKETLKTWLIAHAGVLNKLKSISMDMWDASIGGVRESIPLLARSSLKTARACGFCNRSRFKIAILFQLGELSLLPDGLA